MTPQAVLSRHERAANSLAGMSKMAKFYSAATRCAVKVFQGSEIARLSSTVAKPLKHFADSVDVFSVIDPLNNLLTKDSNGTPNYKIWAAKGKWFKLIARVALVAGLILSPVVFASSTLGLFSLGFLGANIGTVGSLSAIAAVKSSLILASALLGLADADRWDGSEKSAAAKQKLKFKAYRSLLKFRDRSKADEVDVKKRDSAKFKFKARAAKMGFKEKKIDELLNESLNVWDREVLDNHTEYNRKLYETKAIKVTRSEVGFRDDIMKIALLSITFVGAFVWAGLPALTITSIMGVYSAYIGWNKSDLDTKMREDGNALYEWKKAHTLTDQMLLEQAV